MTWVRPLLTASIILILGACSVDSEKLIRKHLEIIIEDDLKTVVEETRENARADTTYYTIVEYTSYNKSKYSRKAVVDFYFLRDVKMKMVRKYRYHVESKKWERYYNSYHFVHE